jgi:LysM repeat protein
VVLAAVGCLWLLALTGCLPLQFGFEPRRTPTNGQAGTSVALASGTSPSPATVSATGTLTRTPAGAGASVTPAPPQASPTGASTQPEATPTPTPSATATRPPATAIECRLTHTVRPGERLTQIGELYGVRWQEIAELNGLENPGLIFAGQVLCLPPNARLPNTPTPTPTPTASASATATGSSTPSATPDLCRDAPAWFVTPTPPVCPTAPAANSQAAAQRFERGQMVWLAARDQYFVLYDGATASTRTMLFLPGPLNLKPGASPDNRVTETPPPGREQPVSGFGLIWRGEVTGSETVREALGWATQSEFGYTTTYQCQASTTAEWNCYLRGPSGQVLRLYFTPGGGYFWDNW